MPKFISPIGTPCTIDEAKPGGHLRAGYKELLEDGEYLHYDIMMLDGASPRRSVYLTDSSADAALRAYVDREEAAHDHKFAFMGDRAPKFDRARAEFLARNHLTESDGKLLRDTALAARSGDPAAAARLREFTDQAEKNFNDQQAARSAERMNAWRTPANTRDPAAVMRDTARLARYSGC